MENPTHSFREINLVLQLIEELQKLELVKEKRGHFLYCLCYSKEIYLTFVFYLNAYFYISKNITSYTFLLAFKIIKSLQCILNFLKLYHYFNVHP